MMEAVLALKIPPAWCSQLSKKYGASIRVIERKPFGRAGMQDLVEINAEKAALDSLLEELKTDATVSKVDIIATERGRAIGIVQSKKCLICRAVMGSDCFLVSSEVKGDGDLLWTVITSSKKSLRKLSEHLEHSACTVKLLKLVTMGENELLTVRQEQIVELAWERGYFSYPRRVGITQLAKYLKVSKSTLSQVLRRGEEKIMGAYFGGIMKRHNGGIIS